VVWDTDSKWIEECILKNIFSKIKLKWRIFGFLLGFCVLLLIILWFFQVALLNEFYRRIRVAETRNDVAYIIEHLYDDDIHDIVSELSEAGDFRVDILDFDGRSLLTDSPSRSRDERESMALISMAQNNNGEFFSFDMTMSSVTDNDRRPGRPDRPSEGQSGNRPDRQSGSQSNRQPNDRRNRSRQFNERTTVESFVLVRIAGDRAVIVDAVLTPVFATTTTLRYQLYAISGIMIILSAALAIIIAKRISKPIEEINTSAKDLAKGQYGTRFNGKGFREIVGLSETLNTAAVELGRTEELRRELLANVSHDLRTPISLIYSYAEMMHDFPEDIKPEQVEVIMEETERLTSLLNDFIDISKLESGMDSLHITRFNITKNISDTINRFKELLATQKYMIRFFCDDDIFIEADEMKIDRAFYNLLVNAINYTDKDKEIFVEVMKTDTGVRISVTDHGEGITEDELPLIWDRYYKSGKAHKRAETGTGLGLSIVKKIIEMHGGTYGVASEANKGSTFWFEIR